MCGCGTLTGSEHFGTRGLKRIHPTVLLMASAHFMVDGYGNIFAPLLPLLIPKLGLSLAAAGTLTMLYQMASSVSQIGFGHVADRWRPRLLRDGRARRRGGGAELRRPRAERARRWRWS